VTAPRQRLGAHGEAVVARWYEARGYTVLARNWRCRAGEIDLVLGRGPIVVVCEVKTRSSDRFGSPFDAVGWQKQQRLRRLAAEWLAAGATTDGRGRAEVRFDVASVLRGQVDVIEGAF
jgi:putative endonuclease